MILQIMLDIITMARLIESYQKIRAYSVLKSHNRDRPEQGCASISSVVMICVSWAKFVLNYGVAIWLSE